MGPGGLLTTAPDLMRWLRNFDTEQVGGRGFTVDMERVGVLRSGRATTYASGLEIGTLAGERMVFHAGWTGGYVAWAGRLPSRRLALGILCNGSGVNTEELGPVLLARLARLTPPSSVRSAFGDTARTGIIARAAGLYRSRRTLQPVTVRGFDQGVTLNTWVGYQRATDSTFTSLDGERALRFTDGANGVPSGFEVRARDGDRVTYDRLDTTLPTPTQLAAYAGLYRSDDVRSEIELRVHGDRLVAWRGGVLHDDLTAIFRDGFRAPSQSWIISITRDANGAIVGFDLALPRMRRLPFVKVR